MDWWWTLHILQPVFAAGALLLAAAGIVVSWRLRGIIHWKRSLRDELKQLNARVGTAGGNRKEALEVVLARCRSAWWATSPGLGELANLSDYIRSIAACYHPGDVHPELQITIGAFLKAAWEFANRLELILERPGFQRFKRVRIRHIHHAYRWYDRINRYRVFHWLLCQRKTINRLLHLRRFILPDPFSWIAFLSNRLTLLVFARCLLVDIYLFVGKAAIQAYDAEAGKGFASAERNGLEASLEALHKQADSAGPADPEIQVIRDRLVGFSSMLISTPGVKEWKKAVMETACIIAGRHFPDSPHPLEEAALGPLLARGRVWLQSICETEKFFLAEKLYGVRIDSLYSVKSLTHGILPKPLMKYAKKTWETYRRVRWPVKIYRRARKATPAGIAMDVGWVVVRKSLVSFICRRTFDLAHQELERIYSRSRFLGDPDAAEPAKSKSEFFENRDPR